MAKRGELPRLDGPVDTKVEPSVATTEAPLDLVINLVDDQAPALILRDPPQPRPRRSFNWAYPVALLIAANLYLILYLTIQG